MARSGGDVPPAAAVAVRSGARRVPDEGPGGLGAAGGRHVVAVAVRSGARRVPDEGPGGLGAAGGRHVIAVRAGGRRCHGATRRSRRLLVTTNTELNAIAAPAIIALSRPAAASGSAATL